MAVRVIVEVETVDEAQDVMDMIATADANLEFGFPVRAHYEEDEE